MNVEYFLFSAFILKEHHARTAFQPVKVERRPLRCEDGWVDPRWLEQPEIFVARLAATVSRSSTWGWAGTAPSRRCASRTA